MTLYNKVFLSALVSATLSLGVHAQISPPGIDDTKAAGWVAIGFSQAYSKKWSSIIYAGASMQSDPNSYALVKPAIFVLNQETYYQFNPHWQLAFAISLRKAGSYLDDAPFSHGDPAWKHEIRYYFRLFYRHQYKSWNFAYSFRPEARTFYTPDGKQWTPNSDQLRFRLKAQATYALDESQTNSIVVANEVLGITNYNGTTHTWSKFQYSEDRLSTYYRRRIKKPDMFLDVGLMQQFWGIGDIPYTIYYAVDVIFRNPFGNPAKK